MKNFDKHMALDVIEDALTNLDNPYENGMAAGLCGAFYMCGLLSKKEWEAALKLINTDSGEDDEETDSDSMITDRFIH